MRRLALMLTALFVLGVVRPALAQQDGPALNDGRGTPDEIVARLMSFDANHDGRIVRAELPERMRGLIARGDTSRDKALDASEVRRLAEAPPAPVVVRGVTPGHYGFRQDSGFDTRMNIQDAIEDLRLAGDRREKAQGVASQFLASMHTRAKADLLTVATPLLSEEQLANFTAFVERTAEVTLVPHFGTLPEGTSRMQRQVETIEAQIRRTVLVSGQLIEKYQLAADAHQKMLAALQRFDTATRVDEEQRSVLLGELHAVLTDEECGDLLAALERRPMVKQS